VSDLGHNSGAGQLRAFVERIERLEEEIKSLNGDKSEIYKEARSTGFDVKTLRKVVTARKVDPSDRQEADALFDAYMAALGELPEGAPRARAHAHVEKIEEFPPAPPPSGADGGQRSIPSSDADGAKMEGRANVNPERAADEAGIANVKSEQAAEDFQPPAFLVKERAPLRPNCLEPDKCAGYGTHTCHRCTVAAEKPEVA
jgi:uncharacterized protein (UPF0335 family)